MSGRTRPLSADSTSMPHLAGVGLRPPGTTATIVGDDDVPYEVEMVLDDGGDDGEPCSVHMINVNGTPAPLRFQVEGRRGGVRELKFTPKQWAKLEAEYLKLVGQFGPNADIMYDVKLGIVRIQEPGQPPREIRVDQGTSGVKEFMQVLWDCKAKELPLSFYHTYDPHLKGDTKGRRALLTDGKMTERLKRMRCRDWAEFRNRYGARINAFITANKPGQLARINANLQRAQDAHVALITRLTQEINQLQTALQGQMDPGVRSSMQASLNTLRASLAQNMDIFAAGMAIVTTPVQSGKAPAQILQEARAAEQWLTNLVAEEEGNAPKTGWFSETRTKIIEEPIMGRVKTILNPLNWAGLPAVFASESRLRSKEIQPAEAQHIKGIVGMGLGFEGNRTVYEEFMGGKSYRDPLEEILLVRYARFNNEDPQGLLEQIPSMKSLQPDVRQRLIGNVHADLIGRHPLPPSPEVAIAGNPAVLAALRTAVQNNVANISADPGFTAAVAGMTNADAQRVVRSLNHAALQALAPRIPTLELAIARNPAVLTALSTAIHTTRAADVTADVPFRNAVAALRDPVMRALLQSANHATLVAAEGNIPSVSDAIAADPAVLAALNASRGLDIAADGAFVAAVGRMADPVAQARVRAANHAALTNARRIIALTTGPATTVADLDVD